MLPLGGGTDSTRCNKKSKAQTNYISEAVSEGTLLQWEPLLGDISRYLALNIHSDFSSTLGNELPFLERSDPRLATSWGGGRVSAGTSAGFCPAPPPRASPAAPLGPSLRPPCQGRKPGISTSKCTKMWKSSDPDG